MHPLVLVKDVHHHVAEIEQYPAPSALAFGTDHAMALRLQLLLDALGDGLDLPIALARPDDEKIRVPGYSPQIVHHHFLRLFLQCGSGGCDCGTAGIIVDSDCCAGHSSFSSLGHVRTCPSPRTTNRVQVSSRRPMGP